MPDEILDDADLALKQWAAEDKSQQHARRIALCMELDPSLTQRLEQAARTGDLDVLVEAVAEVLAALDEPADF